MKKGGFRRSPPGGSVLFTRSAFVYGKCANSGKNSGDGEPYSHISPPVSEERKARVPQGREEDPTSFRQMLRQQNWRLICSRHNRPACPCACQSKFFFSSVRPYTHNLRIAMRHGKLRFHSWRTADAHHALSHPGLPASLSLASKDRIKILHVFCQEEIEQFLFFFF